MKHLINLGSQFIGFRDEANALKGKTALFFMTHFFAKHLFCFLMMGLRPLTIFSEALRRAEERADALAAKLRN
jgi:hypothetical protein